MTQIHKFSELKGSQTYSLNLLEFKSGWYTKGCTHSVHFCPGFHYPQVSWSWPRLNGEDSKTTFFPLVEEFWAEFSFPAPAVHSFLWSEPSTRHQVQAHLDHVSFLFEYVQLCAFMYLEAAFSHRLSSCVQSSDMVTCHWYTAYPLWTCLTISHGTAFI